MEHIGEWSAWTALVWTDEKLLRNTIATGRLTHRKRERIEKPSVFEIGIAAAPKHIEAPVLEPCDRICRPVGTIGELAHVRLAVDAPHSPQTPLSLIAHMVHAEKHRSAAKRIDCPPLAVIALLHTEESGNRVLYPGDETVRFVWRYRPSI